jgi:hypothetical protein
VLRDVAAKSLGVGARHPRIQISECRISTSFLPGLRKSSTCTLSCRAHIVNFDVCERGSRACSLQVVGAFLSVSFCIVALKIMTLAKPGLNKIKSEFMHVASQHLLDCVFMT